MAREHGSPGQIERDKANMIGGDLGGGAFELDQQLIFRPAPKLVRGRTSLRGLYVVSASARPCVGRCPPAR
jgi:phytoene dehydrogenase-like protein